jgi:predicted metalloendopeptidase
MIGNLRGAFNELLTELDWMDENTRTLAKEKVTNTTVIIIRIAPCPN